MNDDEHRIQSEAVKHARLRWPICRTHLFAIPNGGARDAITGKRLKRVLEASRNDEYHSLPERHKRACRAAGGSNELRVNSYAKNLFVKCFRGE
jgi:hypothetical protein